MPFPEPSNMIAAETVAIREFLRTVAVGTVVTFAEVAKASGRDPQKHRSGLLAAIRKLAKEGIIFVSVRGVGYQRIANSQLTDFGSHNLRKCRRVSRRTGDAMTAAVDGDNSLSNPERRQVNLQITRLALISSVGDQRTARHLEQEVAEKPLPPHAAMAALLKAG